MWADLFSLSPFLTSLVNAADAEPHGDTVATVVLAVAVFLVVAKLGSELASRLGQPAVLGELLAGVVLGNLTLLGIAAFEPLKTDPFISVLAGIGVLLLLFEVGLESTVAEMLSVGASAFLVALLGVLAPFGLGWAVSALLLPGESAYVHAFIGATLCATSVGITARVLQDLGWSRSQEARIILGAAVIDDVLGLIILAVVSGAIAAAAAGAPFSFGSIATTTFAAVVFLVGSLVIGVTAAPRLFPPPRSCNRAACCWRSVSVSASCCPGSPIPSASHPSSAPSRRGSSWRTFTTATSSAAENGRSRS